MKRSGGGGMLGGGGMFQVFTLIPPTRLPSCRFPAPFGMVLPMDLNKYSVPTAAAREGLHS